ncbi:MAG: hypothetical protein U1F65_11585 [Verrucomicrobiota bacterium]
MFQVTSDKTTNLLCMIFAGEVKADEVKRCVERVRIHLKQLKPGFRLLNDLSALESMDIASVPHLEDSMAACSKAGVATVVRVIPDPKKDIGFKILSVFHYRRPIRIITCATMMEALKILDE